MPNKANLEKKIAKYEETLAELAGKAGKELERRKFSKLLKRAQRSLFNTIKDEERHAAIIAKGHAKKAEAVKQTEPKKEEAKPEAPVEAKQEEAPAETAPEAPAEEVKEEAPAEAAQAEEVKEEAPVEEAAPEAPAEAPAEEEKKEE